MTFTTDLVETTQGRLADLGYYTGPLDGISGPMTENAMIDFKAAVGFLGRPYPGPMTMNALWSRSAPKRPVAAGMADDPPWLAEARRLLGVREAPGKANNPQIMGWARDLDQWYPGDDTAWCGLFVAHCMKVGAPSEPQDFNRLGARAWLEFGEECQPSFGSVCVLWRTHKTKSWHGHVFLATGISDNAIRGIGGNQSDTVSEAWFDKDRVLGFCKPTGFDLPPLPRAQTGALSTNEA